MIEFTLPGNVIPKARPRVTRNGTFMPPAYKCWKTLAIARLRSQYDGPQIEQAEVSIILRGKHPRRGDCDNIGGSVLDALVQAGILKGDNLMVVSALSVRLEWDKKTEPTTIVQLLV
jgi:Holliday junction resolvase RusA-like endonuclease